MATLRRVTLALAIAVLAGCGGGGGDGGSSAADLVREGADATAEVDSFHFTLDIQNVPRSRTGLQLMAAEGDVDVPDRLRADVSGTFAGVSIATELVSVGKKVWVKNPLSRRWQAIDVGTTPAALLDPQAGALGAMRNLTDVEEQGHEDIDGVDTVKLRGQAKAKDVAPLVAVSPGDGTVDVTVWLGADDKRLRRIRIDGAAADGEPTDASRVVDVSRLGEPVTIEVPEGAG